MSDKANGSTDPEWLDDAYMVKILKKITGDQLKDIKDYTKAPATTKGENYASAMHLITVNYTVQSAPDTIKNLSFIMKSRLDNELMSQIEEDFNVFLREAQVYTVIMEEGGKLMQSVGDDTVFGPRPYYVDERIIVQENLKLKGYRIKDVKTGFSAAECRAILTKLAKFHAVTMVLYKKNPDMFRHHLPGNVSEHSSPLHDMYTNAIRISIDYCQTHPNLQPYVSKLEDFGDKIIPKMINVFSRNLTDRYHVLNHGDVWVNNIMFKESDANQIEDVLFIDYQEGFFGSPGIDWNYFIFSSWQKDVFKNDFDELLQLYHKNLTELLHKLNYTQRIPTVEDVRKEILNKGFHGLATATCLLPILINEHEDLADPVNFLMETEEAIKNRRIIFDNPKFGERLVTFLEFFVENGIL